MAEALDVPVAKIIVDPEIQQRAAGLDEDHVIDLIEAYQGGGPLPPPITVFEVQDGRKTVYLLADGFHRLEAHRRIGALKIRASVRSGTRDDAILYAVGANTAHGLRRTNADKKKAVETLLRHPVWSGWSDRELSRRAGVSNGTIHNVRQALTVQVEQSDVPRTYTTKHGTTAVMNVSRIGKSKPATSPPEEPKAKAPAPPVVEPAPQPEPAPSSPVVVSLQAVREKRAEQELQEEIRGEQKAFLEHEALQYFDDGKELDYKSKSTAISMMESVAGSCDNILSRVNLTGEEWIESVMKEDLFNRQVYVSGMTKAYKFFGDAMKAFKGCTASGIVE